MKFDKMNRDLEILLQEIITNAKKLDRSVDIVIYKMRKSIPKYERNDYDHRIEKLCSFGCLIKEKDSYNITARGEHYFRIKEEHQKKITDKNQNDKKFIPLITTNAPTNIIIGDFYNSTVSIEQSIMTIETYIEENGGEDKAELRELIEEAKIIISEIGEESVIKKKPSFIEKLGNHINKHYTLYSEIVKLFGAAMIREIGS